ncbi:hypothetical protein [Idiomarina loihiensis]|uniref:hypothetical protein n=1 Tax=Idiomarina loihiensis TaxID=135577 RepID=UPI00384F2970
MEFDKDKYKVWKLPHPMLVHWVVNPGIAFNELILGQRIPKVTLIDKTSDAPLMERQSIPCPECETLNDARLWSKGNAFGHWFGFVCPNCHGKIPCLWSMASLLILAATFPIWIWIKLFGEAKWLEKEKARFPGMATKELPTAKKTSWVKMGVCYGALIFCFSLVLFAIANRLSLSAVLVLAAIWACAGLAFGGIMKWLIGRRNKR